MQKRNPFDEEEWVSLLLLMEKQLGKKLSFEGMLYLVGIQELGKGPRIFSKEEKQDLMHIAICKLLSQAGYYTLEGLDKDGWPHWKSCKPLPFISLREQEAFLKLMTVEYFKQFFDSI